MGNNVIKQVNIFNHILVYYPSLKGENYLSIKLFAMLRKKIYIYTQYMNTILNAMSQRSIIIKFVVLFARYI